MIGLGSPDRLEPTVEVDGDLDARVPEQTRHQAVGSRVAHQDQGPREMPKQMWVNVYADVLQDRANDGLAQAPLALVAATPAGPREQCIDLVRPAEKRQVPGDIFP